MRTDIFEVRVIRINALAGLFHELVRVDRATDQVESHNITRV